MAPGRPVERAQLKWFYAGAVWPTLVVLSAAMRAIRMSVGFGHHPVNRTATNPEEGSMTTSTAPSVEPASRDGLRAVLDTGPRPPRATATAAALAFARRALVKIRHVPEQLSDVILIPVIFTLLFTYMFGGALVGSTSEYLQFLLPGSLVMSVLLVTIYAGVTLHTDIATGAFDRFRTLPI